LDYSFEIDFHLDSENVLTESPVIKKQLDKENRLFYYLMISRRMHSV